MSSTLLDGFYTQPLGFVLLLCWMLFNLNPPRRPRFAVSAVLLAYGAHEFLQRDHSDCFYRLGSVCDIVTWLAASDLGQREQLRRIFFLHFLSPWLALALSAFWLVPMLSSYEYLVTRPLIRAVKRTDHAAFVVLVLSRRHWRSDLVASSKRFAWSIFTRLFDSSDRRHLPGSFAPVWFPFQVFRFFSTINFLLCVPVGISLAYVAKCICRNEKDGLQTAAE